MFNASGVYEIVDVALFIGESRFEVPHVTLSFHREDSIGTFLVFLPEELRPIMRLVDANPDSNAVSALVGKKLFLEFRADRVYSLSNLDGSAAITLRELRESAE